MASTILKRLKYCNWDGYEHLKCYRDNDVRCYLGKTTKEISDKLLEHFRSDIVALIADGKTPTVDRIDSKGHYELGNIRIIDLYENAAQGLQNANEPRKQPVQVIYSDGSAVIYESIREAARKTSLSHSCVTGLIQRKGASRKERLRFCYA